MTKLMAILNTTPDSFYDQGKYALLDSAIKRACEMEREGADLIDIGGQSTRPGAEIISAQEEIQRTIPLIEALSDQIQIPLSVDTMTPEVAKAAVKRGVSLINDVSGFRNPEMVRLAADTGVDICVMHMQGTPETMQRNPDYPEGVVPHLLNWFKEKIKTLLQRGIQEKQIIIDPGIGFGKTVAHNLEIIDNLQKFKALGFQVLLGLSRKSFMGRILCRPPSALLCLTVAMNTIGILKGADWIRVHDVKEHRDLIDLIERFP